MLAVATQQNFGYWPACFALRDMRVCRYRNSRADQEGNSTRVNEPRPCVGGMFQNTCTQNQCPEPCEVSGVHSWSVGRKTHLFGRHCIVSQQGDGLLNEFFLYKHICHLSFSSLLCWTRGKQKQGNILQTASNANSLCWIAPWSEALFISWVVSCLRHIF